MSGNMNIILTEDPRMKKVLEAAERVALSKASVLIYGESGTGKELISRYIHSKSQRFSKPFYAINCAALPEGLLESELFGYEKGAFTGADKRQIGKFESASGSSFLLDEISEIPLHLQAKLLRVLQEGEVIRLGSSHPIKIDLRILATSNKNLSEMVKLGQFREDLYYRLNVIPLQIPPLRHRPCDLEVLSRNFLTMFCSEVQRPTMILSDGAIKKIKKWHWPGNVRELENVIERSVLMSKKNILMEEDILIRGFSESHETKDYFPGKTIAEVEKTLILNTLEFTSQNRTQAAQMLGISIRTLRNKIREYREKTSPQGGRHESKVF